MLWVKSNKLTINIDKTYCISFINYIEFEIAIENKPIVKLSEKKLLRLLIDNSVHWKSHFQFLKNKFLTLYWIIKKLSFCLNESAMIKLYYAVFYPHLIFCLEILGHTYKSNIDCIHFIQKKVLKLVFSKFLDFSSKKLCIGHKLLITFDVYQYKTLIFMHNIYYITCNPCIYKIIKD